MSCSHFFRNEGEFLCDFNIELVNQFTGEVLTDFRFPLKPEVLESATFYVQEVEDAISELEFRSNCSLPENHELVQLEKELTRLFQRDAEWHKAHPMHW